MTAAKEEVVEQATEQKKITDEMVKQEELVKKLSAAGFKVSPVTGDIFNPRNFSSEEFKSLSDFHEASKFGGIEINIENVNGLDPEEVASALQRILTEKVST